MMHYSCDQCGKELDPESDRRFLVSIEIAAPLDPSEAEELADDRDYLQEIHETLQRCEETPASSIEASLPAEMQFDLCGDCARKFLKNPLGRKPSKQFNFSQN